MGRKANMIERLAMYADLPSEHTIGMPVIELAGNSRVLIENHMGVSGYDQSKICVKVCYGLVVVQGICLQIMHMNRYQLVIKGKISGISLNAGG